MKTITIVGDSLQVIDIALLTSLNIYFVGFGFEDDKVAGVIHANFLSSII